jgi:GNAT superfamily N-acetyltransferase
VAAFDIEALRPTHDRKAFACGVAPLDRYLAEFATQDIKRRVSNCYVALDQKTTVAGYYTFAASSIPLGDLPPDLAKRLPRYPLVPAALVGRLAVDRNFQGIGLGATLVVDALQRCTRADLAIHALLVDAKDEAAARFYTRLGFLQCVSRPMSFFLPIGTAVRLLSKP